MLLAWHWQHSNVGECFDEIQKSRMRIVRKGVQRVEIEKADVNKNENKECIDNDAYNQHCKNKLI